MSSDTKEFVFGDSKNGQSVVSVYHAGEYQDPDKGFSQPVYGYKIVTDRWEFVNEDIRGAEQETPDLDKAAQSLFFYLHECVRKEDTEFPTNVRAWASRYMDEIADLATASEPESPVMTTHNGVLVPSDEDSTQF